MSPSSSSSPTSPTPTSIEAPAKAKRQLPRAVKIAGAILLGLVVLPGLLYAFPIAAGSDHAYVVLSGSMEPFFSPGDIIFVQDVDVEKLEVGTIITFHASEGSERLYTHRIIEVVTDGGAVRYVTKGDANEDPDPSMVKPAMIVGAYDFQMPYYGHLLQLFRSKAGFLILVIVPGVLIVGSELVKLYKMLDAMDRVKQAKKKAAAEEKP